MVSTKGYWDMINEHIVNSDLEYLETKKNCGPPLVYVILANELVGAAWPRGRALFSQRGS